MPAEVESRWGHAQAPTSELIMYIATCEITFENYHELCEEEHRAGLQKPAKRFNDVCVFPNHN